MTELVGLFGLVAASEPTANAVGDVAASAFATKSELTRRELCRGDSDEKKEGREAESCLSEETLKEYSGESSKQSSSQTKIGD